MSLSKNAATPESASLTPRLQGARILVATDLSPASDEALIEADRWARALGGSLSVLHVVPFAVRASVLFPQNVASDASGFVELVSRIAAAISDRVAEKTGRTGDQVDIRVETGAADATIVRKAEELDAGLLVIGSHGTDGFGRRVLGAVAERVVRHAHCPVLVARWQAAKGHVLAATDFSDPSFPAVEMAAELAAVAGAKLTLLHAVPHADPSPSNSMWSNEVPFFVPVPQPELVARAREALQALSASRRITADLRVVAGSPAAAIAAVAEELSAELVVVGAHGRTGLPRLLLGSVAEKVIRAAPCSVLAVRAGTRG
jgi:nucleotide-binding universal stress UspA family protein